MRIMLVTTDFFPNVSGVATLSHGQAKCLARQGHKVRVVTTTSGASSQTEQGLFEVREFRNTLPPVIRLAAFFRIMNRAIREWKPDLVWCTNYRGFGLPVMVQSRRHGIPYGLYVHGTELITENKKSSRKTIFTSVMKHAVAIGSNSGHTNDLLAKLYGFEGTVIAPGVDPAPAETEEFLAQARKIRADWLSRKPSSVPDEKRFVFLSSSRISRQKGIQRIIEAVSLLEPELRQRVLYVVGGQGPDLEEFQQLAEKLNVQDHVIFNGRADRKDLMAIYKAADVYLQPSQPEGDFLEGYGISFVEAQSVGVPCIASDWCGTPDAVRRDVTALLIAPGSTQSVLEAMKRVMQDDEWRKKAGEEGKSWARENTWDCRGPELDRFLSASLSRGKR